MSIHLIRHGKPEGAINPRVDAAGFKHWVEAYEASSVSADQAIPESLTAPKPAYVVSSDRRRAVASAELCYGRPPDGQLRELREMAIPAYVMPFRLKAYSWLMLNRGLWYLGVATPTESFAAGKRRAAIVTSTLQTPYAQQGSLAVFGHVLMNKQIARELKKRRWVGRVKHLSYWGSMTFEPPS